MTTSGRPSWQVPTPASRGLRPSASQPRPHGLAGGREQVVALGELDGVQGDTRLPHLRDEELLVLDRVVVVAQGGHPQHRPPGKLLQRRSSVLRHATRQPDEACDLIAMGAYGHSRVREYTFGGVTRDILRHMTVPTLFAH